MATAELEEQFGRIGQNAMPAEQTLQALETLMSGSTAQKMVASIDWNKFKPVYETKRKRPLIECIEVKEAPEQKSSPTFSEQK